MCGMLDHYLLSFANIRVNTNPSSWPEASNFKSPYKPFLLLSVLDLIAGGSITRNFIEPSPELAETWQGYMAVLSSMNRQASMAYPFFTMGKEEFWNLRPRDGMAVKPGQTITSLNRLREYYYGAKLNDDLFPLLVMKPSREKLRTILLESFFNLEFRAILRE